MHRTIICVVGTRPEAIKMAPVIRELKKSGWARCVVVVTAQHRDLLDGILERFDIGVDHDLDLMRPDQSPGLLISRMMPALEKIISAERADAVLAQGDTATVFSAAVAAFHTNVPFGHVEAGLRTGDLAHPYPEEGYRQMVARIARWHFAPTESAKRNLLNEGVSAAAINVTGNTGIDSLLHAVETLGPAPERSRRLILMTAHRRESFGRPLESIFAAVQTLVGLHDDIEIAFPVHPNPNVIGRAHTLLGDHPRIHLLKPLGYFDFVDLMRQATLVLSDSGGVQEEAPALGKPVLVTRDCTERPEAVEAGVAKIVGTDPAAIVESASDLLTDREAYAAMARGISPYGDGKGAIRIARMLQLDMP